MTCSKFRLAIWAYSQRPPTYIEATLSANSEAEAVSAVVFMFAPPAVAIDAASAGVGETRSTYIMF